MSEQNDDAQHYALLVLSGVIALVVAGVIALAAATTMRKAHAPVVPPAAAAAAEVAEPDARLYFEVGSDALPADASAVLVRVADAVRADAARVVQISGFHDASGDATQNAELAKKRALAVRHALEANGVTQERIVLDKPAVTTGGADAREARRVEVRVR